MAYCRFGKDSDVYVYAHIDGGYSFHLAKDSLPVYNVPTAREDIDKLKELKAQGYKVPKYAIKRLEDEVEE